MHSKVQRQGVQVPIYLAAVFFYILLIPEQANFRVGGILLSPYRLYLIAGSLYLLGGSIKSGFRFAWPDLAVLGACFWIALASYVVTQSFEAAIVQGGAHAIDIGMAYFFMRFAIRTPRDLRLFLVMIVPGVALMGAIVFLELVTGRHIIQPLFSAITGNPVRGDVEVRLGLTRGVASFPHAILAGICLASFLTLYWMSGIRGWPKIVGAAAAFCGFFTMSSAALLGLLVGTALMVFDWLNLRIQNITWRLFMLASTILYATVELTSDSGFFNLLVRYASLRTVSAYNRVLIWKYGSESVWNHPMFGIGYEDWVRPSWMNWSTSSSIDHFWLILAMRFGLPASLLLILVVVAAVILVALRSARMSTVDARLMRGVAISLAVFALGAVSVSLWLNALVWFFMLVGIAVSLGVMPAQQRVVMRPIVGGEQSGARGFSNPRASLERPRPMRATNT